MTITKTKTNNVAIEELIEEYKDLNQTSKSHGDWCIKQISNACKFEGGFIYEFTKPRIKKTFCFGAGMYATCTDEEQESASAMVEQSRNDSQYFIDENIKENFDNIDRFFEGDLQRQGWTNIFATHSMASKKTKRCYLISEKEILYRDLNKDDYYKLTDADKENLKKVIVEEKEKFIKRLNTYLKKYGLSKVDSWSYIRD